MKSLPFILLDGFHTGYILRVSLHATFRERNLINSKLHSSEGYLTLGVF